MRAAIAGYVRRPSGRAVGGATIVVSRGGTVTAGTLTGGSAVPVYAAYSGTAQAGSGGTLTADSDGRYAFYAEEGDYAASFSKANYGTWSEAFPAVSGLSPGGRELASATKADANQTGITTSAVDITNLNQITFSVEEGRPVYVTLFIPWCLGDRVGAYVAAIITDGSNVVRDSGASAEASRINGTCGAVRAVERITVAGSYTRKGRTQSGGAASSQGSILASSVLTTRLWAETR